MRPDRLVVYELPHLNGLVLQPGLSHYRGAPFGAADVLI